MSDAISKPTNWNVPNALTTLRILIVPFFGYALLHEHGSSAGWRWVAYGLFAVAMVTDKIDGDLARKHNLITDFGKIVDPIADKAVTGMAFIGLSIVGALWWWVTIVVLIREWGVTIARLSIAKRVVLPANRSGKLKTLAQAFALGGFVAPLKFLPGDWHTPGRLAWWVFAALMATAVVLTVTSGIEFARQAYAERHTGR